MTAPKKYIEISKGVRIEVDVDITQEELNKRVDKWLAAVEKSNNHLYNPKGVKNYNLKSK